MEEQTLNELLNEVNDYVQESKDTDYFVVGDSPASDAPAGDETVEEASSEEQSALSADDVEQIVQDTLDARQSDNAELASLAQMYAAQQYGYLPNLSSSQMTYFEGVCAGHPFADYYAVYDGNKSYSLYYGYGLKQAGGQKCNYIKITYNKNDYYEYTIDKGETTAPAVDAGQATYCSYVDTCARFPRVEVIKFETFTAAALVCALGLWLLGKLFFR